jgi:predicted membrane protein
MFKPREEDLTIVMAEMEKYMIAKLLTMLGLGEVLKKPSPENILKLLAIAALFLFGAYFFISFVMPGLMHAVPAPPAGVKVP